MSVAPLLEAAPAIPLHAFAAMAAFVLGLVQFAAPKGTLPHRTIGWIWVALMAVVAASSFWIHQIRRAVQPDPSPVDLHAGDATARGVAGAYPSGRRSPAYHDHDVRRRARHCRAVHARAWTDHAPGDFRSLGRGSRRLIPASLEAVVLSS
ncbi:hypothetical protein ABIB08_002780 [Bradyrhizobium sp. RT11b]